MSARSVVAHEPGGAPTAVQPAEEDPGVAVIEEQLTRLARRILYSSAPAGPANLERAAYSMLRLLVSLGPQRCSTLATALQVDLSTASRQAAALTAAGLVERRPDPGDGRAHLLAATDDGQDAYETSCRQRRRRLEMGLSSWSAADRQRFGALLARFNDAVESVASHPSPAPAGAGQPSSPRSHPRQGASS